MSSTSPARHGAAWTTAIRLRPKPIAHTALKLRTAGRPPPQRKHRRTRGERQTSQGRTRSAPGRRGACRSSPPAPACVGTRPSPCGYQPRSPSRPHPARAPRQGQRHRVLQVYQREGERESHVGEADRSDVAEDWQHDDRLPCRAQTVRLEVRAVDVPARHGASSAADAKSSRKAEREDGCAAPAEHRRPPQLGRGVCRERPRLADRQRVPYMRRPQARMALPRLPEPLPPPLFCALGSCSVHAVQVVERCREEGGLEELGEALRGVGDGARHHRAATVVVRHAVGQQGDRFSAPGHRTVAQQKADRPECGCAQGAGTRKVCAGGVLTCGRRGSRRAG